MEVRRFGSNITGTYWGCCACCIMQNFNHDPDSKASTQLVHGDSGTAMVRNGENVYFGPTYRDIFLNRLRVGTFSDREMPNHAFLAILTASQVLSPTGQKWLKLMKENGFEFIRSFDNSVYTGADPAQSSASPHINYLFGLFRNIGQSAVPDPMLPPAYWAQLPPAAAQHEIWNAGQTTYMTAGQLIEAGAPVMKSGTQGKKPEDIAATIKAKAEPKAKKGAKAETQVEEPVASSQPAA